MDLSPTEDKAPSKEQLTALEKAAKLELEFMEGIQKIADNLMVNTKNFDLAKQHIVMGVMLFRRAIAKPNEK